MRGGGGTEGRLFRRGRGGVVVYVENVDCIEEGEGMHIKFLWWRGYMYILL